MATQVRSGGTQKTARPIYTEDTPRHPDRVIDGAYNRAIVERLFEDGSIPLSKLATDPPTTSYLDRLLATNPIAVWPLNESSGTTAINAVTTDRNGTYSGVTLDATDSPVVGERAALWIPDNNSYCDIFSNSLQSAWDFNEFSILFHFKVFDATVYEQGQNRYILNLADSNFTDHVFGGKSSAPPDQMILNPQNFSNSIEGFSSVEWNCLALTFNVSTNRSRAYLNGTLFNSYDEGLSSNSSQLGSDACYIGSLQVNFYIWHGYISYVSLWNTELTTEQIAELSTI